MTPTHLINARRQGLDGQKGEDGLRGHPVSTCTG